MLKKMVSMARSVEELKDANSAMPVQSLYDYGLTIRLNDESLGRLDLDTSDVEVGDLLDFRAMAEVTSVSKHDTGDGEKCCVELQITHLGLEGNESTESADEAE